MNRPNEDDLIARYFAPIAGPEALGLLDDAALVAVPAGHELVVTKDALVAGVHFFPDDPPAAIARKALRVNLSDLAAKRSRPSGFMLGLVLPRDWTGEWLEAFADGLAQDAVAFGCPLLGGDTVSTAGPLVLSITALGLVETGAMLRRTTARPGDLIYVSGTIGDAALGLKLRLEPHSLPALKQRPGAREHLLDRYLVPQPRLQLRSALHVATCGMDVSDGLVGDVSKMLRASGVSGRIDLGRLPLSEAARAALAAEQGLLETIATGGDDYEIIATVPVRDARTFEAGAALSGITVTRIGEVLAGAQPPVFLGSEGLPVSFARGSFSHY